MCNVQLVGKAVTRVPLITLAVVLYLSGFKVPAQAQYTTATGTPTFATAYPVEMGFTDVPNGNLHLEIPLASFPQRGNLAYNARLVYDSLIWKIVGTTWQPTNVPNSMGGWRLITGGEVGTVTYITTSNPCDTPPPIQYRTVFTSFTWKAPDGTAHTFPIYTMRDTTICKEDVSSSAALADDSSGYYMSVTNYTSATVYAPNGTQVYPTVMDTNGNYFSTDGSGNIIDTLQRTPITVTTNGNTITYAVLNPQGARTNITVTTTTVSANTLFGKSGVTECQTNCTVTAIQSIAFDDGTSYSFTYDSGTSSGHFAELASMTLRTGANISYGYTTFADGAGNYDRWLSSKTVGSNPPWTFTPQAQSLTAQQVTVVEPTGDKIIYSFSLNNGAWVSGATYVDAAKGTLLYLTNTWDTSQPCPYTGCAGSAYIRKLTAQTQIANGPSKTVTYLYTSPSTGQVSEIDESDYSSGAPPVLRKTLISYASLTNTVTKPLQVIVKDGSNNTVSQTNYTYDEPQYLTTTSGIVQHRAPTSSRGNATTISKWISGSNFLTSHTNYYDTGVPFQTIDPNTSSTQYSYMCQGAYPSSIAAPLSLTTTLNWDCNTGLLTSANDANNQVTSYHYDSEGRTTEIDYPDGGQKKTAYNLSATPPNIVGTTKIDSTKNLISTTLLDGLARPYQSQINSDPQGVDYVDTTYDKLGRTQTVSNPYRATSDPTYGVTTTQYDVLNRVTQVTSQDGGISAADYSQFPTITVTDQAGKQRRSRSDGLGRLVELDEPGDAFAGTAASGSLSIGGSLRSQSGVGVSAGTGNVTIDGSEQRVNPGDCPGPTYVCYIYDSGSVSIWVNGVLATVNFGQGSYPSGIATNLANVINGNGAYPATASVSGSTVYLTSKAAGSSSNYSLSASYSFDSADFFSSSFTTSTSGSTLTGGSDGVTVWDSGTVTVTVGNTGFTAGAPYSQSGNSTAAMVAAALVGTGPTGLNRSGSPVTATASGGTISFTYHSVGSGTVAVTASSTPDNPGLFPGGSFSGSTTLGGGTDPYSSGLAHPFVTLYAYDAQGRLLRVDQKGSAPNDSSQWRTRTFAYDALSRLLCSANPEIGGAATCPNPDSGTYTTGTIRYTYDNNGNVLTRQAPAPNQTGTASVTTTYAYDQLNRLKSKTYSDTTPAVSFAYDSTSGWGVAQTNTKGRLHAASVSNLVPGQYAEIFGYDAVGRTVLNNQCLPDNCPAGGLPVSYSYDLIGDMTSYTTGAGVTFTQSFDSVGRVATLTSNLSDANHPGTLATIDPTVGYYAAGNVRKISYGNSLTETAAYNVLLQPCRTNVNSSGSALLNCPDAAPTGTVQDFNYGFNPGASDNGNLASFAASGKQAFNRTYGYDSLNRLASMSAPGDSCSGLSWTYDAWGNRTDQTITGGTCGAFHQSVNSQNRLSASPYQYDAVGNLTNDGSHAYTYDAENRLTQVDGGNTATYEYDALGRRVRKTIGSTWYDYLYDLSGNVVSEFSDPPGTCTAPCWGPGYIYINGQLSAEYTNGTTYFVHKDHLGSTRLLTGVNQSIFDSMDYLLYGEQIGGGTGTTHKFTGDERDSETNLDHTWFRQYGSAQGRWSAPDPYLGSMDVTDPQSLNRYAYVGNNPINLVDPLGLGVTVFCNGWVNSGAGDVCDEYVLLDTVGNGAGVDWSGVGSGGGDGGGGRGNSPCKNGWGSGGGGIGAGYNVDLGVGPAGASSTAGVGAGLFHNKAGGIGSGYSGGAFASGAATAFAGSHNVGAPKQDSSTTFALGAYAGAGFNGFISNAASSQQVAGPFTTVSINVGIGVANLGVQVSFGGGIWQVSVTPPVVSVGFGAAGSVVTTNTAATHTGCHN